MARLNKTLIAFTSPRTIEKIIPEIDLLVSHFSGKYWSKQLQIDFFKVLSASPFFEKRKESKRPDFSGRERITRAPKALGFVDLKPKISLTPAGKQLLSGRFTHEVIAKQLLKFQLPSPFHRDSQSVGFNIRPYLELLRLVYTLGSTSKTEIAIFFVPMKDYREFDTMVSEIHEFRRAASEHKGNRKAFNERIFDDRIKRIYAEELEKSNTKTRESSDRSPAKFFSTKKQNLRDYADAFFRYLRATELVSLDKNFRMVVSKARLQEVEYILKNVPREVLKFRNLQHFKTYLFSPDSLHLLTDERTYLEKRLEDLSIAFDKDSNIEELKDLLERSETEIIADVVSDAERSLKNYHDFDDIQAVFKKIVKKEIPDPSLYLEWNTWRALAMLNHAKEVKGNFRFDLDGMPLNTALGNLPDIQIDYGLFKVIVEVTLSTGNKQYEMEGEPVARHFGSAQRNSEVPVYCIFIAPMINDNALAHFFNLNRLNTKAYGGKTRILPINLSQFGLFITVARDKNFNTPKQLQIFLDFLFEKNQFIEDEGEWKGLIEKTLPKWLEK